MGTKIALRERRQHRSSILKSVNKRQQQTVRYTISNALTERVKLMQGRRKDVTIIPPRYEARNAPPRPSKVKLEAQRTAYERQMAKDMFSSSEDLQELRHERQKQVFAEMQRSEEWEGTCETERQNMKYLAVVKLAARSYGDYKNVFWLLEDRRVREFEAKKKWLDGIGRIESGGRIVEWMDGVYGMDFYP